MEGAGFALHRRADGGRGATLPELLKLILAAWRDRGCEIVLVDGGSRDDSVAIARAAVFRVMVAERGRASR